MIQVYKVTCRATAKAYIGMTSVSIERRWREHQSSARSSSRDAIHCALRKYGPHAFNVEVIAEAFDWASACEAERECIESHRTLAPLGYNMMRGGQGHQLHEAEKRARATAARGRRLSAATRAKMSVEARRVAFDQAERRRRSERAKAQHAAGNLGWNTLSSAGKARVRAAGSAAIKEHGAKGRAKAFAAMTSAEMSRRSYCRKMFDGRPPNGAV